MNNIKTKLTQSNNQRVVLFQLILLVSVLLNIAISCGSSSKINRINQEQIIGVQLVDGQVVTAQTAKVNERGDEVIRSFIQKWLYLSFNWTTDDVTVKVERTKVEIPGNVYASTYPITTRQDFRTEYSQEFAALIKKATDSKSSIQSAISIDYISEEPVQIRDGIWEVIVISTWVGLDTSQGQEVFQVPFNKKIRLKSIPIADKPNFLAPEDITNLQSIIDQINQYGLQIISIENYDPQ